MKRVIQRDYENGDCGIACVAMLSGLSYKKVHDVALQLGLKSPEGTYYTKHKDLKGLLSQLGVNSGLKHFKTMREVMPNSIVAVNRRKSGHWHWIVITTSRTGAVLLLDPNPKKPSRIESLKGYIGFGRYVHCS